METASYVMGVVFAITAILSALVFSDGHPRDLGLWIACVAIIIGVVGGFCWYQDRLWKEDDRSEAKSQESVANVERRPWLGINPISVETPILGQKLKSMFVIRNTGKTPGSIIRGVAYAACIKKDAYLDGVVDNLDFYVRRAIATKCHSSRLHGGGKCRLCQHRERKCF